MPPAITLLSNYRLLILMTAVLMIWPATVAGAGDKAIRAKMGIELISSGNMVLAKPRQIVKQGDMIRIYVHSGESANVYVVYTDQKEVVLLNMTQQKIGESTLCLPSVRSYYKVDGKSPVERFTIICSPDELPGILSLADSKMSWKKWAAMEQKLHQKGRIALESSREPSIEIAGTVRGAESETNQDRFMDKLPLYSGKGILVKTYEFRIQI